MAKRSTPEFLAKIKASIDAAKKADLSDRVKQAAKTAEKTSQKKAARNDSRQTEAKALAKANIIVPDYVGLMSYDSQTWQDANEVEGIIPASQKDKDGEFKQHIGAACKNAKGIVGAYWSAKATLREKWAREIVNPTSIRDAIFNAIPAGPIKDLEREYLPKWGDYRTLAWPDWCDKLWDLHKPRKFDPDKEIWEAVKEYVVWELLTIRGTQDPQLITPMLSKDLLETVTINKNSGMPFCTSKWRSNDGMVEFFQSMAGAMLDGTSPVDYVADKFTCSLESARILTAAILFNRRQSNGGIDKPGDEVVSTSPTRGDGKASVKMRPVECPPKADALAGKPFIDPMLGVMRQIPCYVGLSGADNIGHYMHKLVETFPFCLEGDFSSFDASCQRAMMTEVMSVISQLFPGHFKPYFEMIADWYSSMYIINPSGICTGEHGLLSGCAWTSILGTITNRLCTLYTLFRMGFNATDDTEVEHVAFGDDTALLTTRMVDIPSYENIMKEVGMDCNRAKQSQSQGNERYVTFLGYRHFNHIKPSLDYVGIFPALRCQLVYLERYTEDLVKVCSDMSITPKQFDIMRYICKLENLRNHPYRMEVLKILVDSGLPLEHITYSGEIPDNLRVGRKSRGLKFSSQWVLTDYLETNDLERACDEFLSQPIETRVIPMVTTKPGPMEVMMDGDTGTVPMVLVKPEPMEVIMSKCLFQEAQAWLEDKGNGLLYHNALLQFINCDGDVAYNFSLNGECWPLTGTKFLDALNSGKIRFNPKLPMVGAIISNDMITEVIDMIELTSDEHKSKVDLVFAEVMENLTSGSSDYDTTKSFGEFILEDTINDDTIPPLQDVLDSIIKDEEEISPLDRLMMMWESSGDDHTIKEHSSGLIEFKINGRTVNKEYRSDYYKWVDNFMSLMGGTGNSGEVL